LQKNSPIMTNGGNLLSQKTINVSVSA